MDADLKALRVLATEIMQRKRARADAAELRDLGAKAQMAVLALRDSSKRHALRVEELKDETGASKAELEQADLALQNLLYEKQYYEKEIRSCRAFQVGAMRLPISDWT